MFEPFLKQTHRHHLLNTGCILILPILKDFFYLINLIFKLQVGYHVVFKLIVCEGQKSPYVWGKTPVWAFCPTSMRAFCLTDGKNYSHQKTLYFVRFQMVYTCL